MHLGLGLCAFIYVHVCDVQIRISGGSIGGDHPPHGLKKIFYQYFYYFIIIEKIVNSLLLQLVRYFISQVYALILEAKK